MTETLTLSPQSIGFESPNVFQLGSTTEQDWSNIDGVYQSSELQKRLQSIEISANTTYEIARFASLVNMSTAGKLPFHRWLRYREGYSGELVKEILTRYPIDTKREFVMDPMCGSGSTLVACKQDGISSLGSDVSGYAVLSSRVKSRLYDTMTIEGICESLGLFEKTEFGTKYRLPEEKRDCLDRYFQIGRLQELHSMLIWSKNLQPAEVREFFQLGVLSAIEDCSDRKKDGNGLATRPSPVTEVKERVLHQLQVMLKDVSSDSARTGIPADAVEASALEMRSSVEAFTSRTGLSLGSIIFSPPYANSFDYYESYKLELILGDFISDTTIKGGRAKMIRNYRIGYGGELESGMPLVELLCKEIWSQIPVKEKETGVRDGRTRLIPNMLRAYFSDMREVLAQGLHCLQPHGRMHIVVDQSAYVGVPIPTDLVFCELASELGFEVESLIVCRKANTSGQQLKRHPFLRNFLRESIVTLKKSE